MPPRIRLAGPPPSSTGTSSPQPSKPDQTTINDNDDNFSPSNIPPPDETPPPASPDSSPINRSNNNNNINIPAAGISNHSLNINNQQQQQQPHLRKRSDVTMRAEYEMELERKHQLTVRAHEHQRAANLEGTGSERQALFDEKGRPLPASSSSLFGDASDEDQIQVAKAALKAAKIREQQTIADLRRAREELESGRGVGDLRQSNISAPPTSTARDVQIRKMDPQILQQNAKQKREQLDEEKKAAREHKENSIFRGPEVAQVAAAANNLKTEVNFICQGAIDALEKAIHELREEKEQLMVRLERTERGLREDASRAEGELHWIDYASAEAKKMIDEAALRREKESREKERKEELAKRRQRGQTFVEKPTVVTTTSVNNNAQQQPKPTWKLT